MRKILAHRGFHLLLGFAVSFVLLIWLIKSIEWGQVWVEMRKIHPYAFIPATLIMLLHFWLRSYRWKYLLPKCAKDPSMPELFAAIMLGNFATYILPLRAGEFVRPYLITRSSKHSFSTAFASVVIERFLDLSMVLLSFAWIIQKVPSIPDWAHHGALILAALAGAILCFICVGVFIPERVLKIIDYFLRIVPEKMRQTIRSFFADLLISSRVIANPLNLIRVVVLTVVIWLTCFAIFYAFFYLFDMQKDLLLSVATAVIIALAVAAPSAPGFIAVYQTACIASFHLFGLSNELGAAYSIITHVYQYAFFTLVAVLYFFTHNISFSEITRRRP